MAPHEGERLYAAAVAVEKELRALLQPGSGRSPGDAAASALRQRLCESYEAVLFADYAFSQVKDVEAQLWKNVFYRYIEDFRQRLKKFSAAAAAGEPRAEESVAKTTEALCALLDDGQTYYTGLHTRLQEAYGSVDAGEEGGAGTGASRRPRGSGAVDAAAPVSRCMLYLGDLSRYAALQAAGPAASKDWSAPAEYYAAAARLCPAAGIPHNQLAVVATYTRDHLRAAYRYARAHACASPFPTARENLRLLLEKEGGGAGGSGPEAATPESAAPEPARAAAEAAMAALAALFQRRADAPAAAEAALRALDAALAAPRAAATLLAWQPDGAAPPLLLLLATALCAHISAGWAAPAAPPSANSPGAASATLLYGVAARLLARAAAEARSPPPRGAALGAALPWLEWAAAAVAARGGGGVSHSAGPGAPPPERAARAAAWSAAASLLNALHDAGAGAGPPPSRPRDACAEDYELRGLLPLADAHAALRFGGSRDCKAACAAAAAGEGAAAAAQRAERALAAGVRLAAAGAAAPLLRSPATGRFAAVGAAADAAFAVPMPAPQRAPVQESLGALIGAGEETYDDDDDDGAAAVVPMEEPAPAMREPIDWRPQPQAGGHGVPSPPPQPSHALTRAMQHAPPPPPPATLLAGLDGGRAASDSDRWAAVFGAGDDGQPLPFPGLLAAAAARAPPPPPPGFLPLRTSNPFIGGAA